MRIRPATPDDLDAMFEIYNHEALHGVATFDTDPVTPERARAWLFEHQADNHPVIVAEESGEILGWASCTRWSTRCAYARAAEESVYVHPSHRGRGVGRALLAELIERARDAGLCVLLARIESGGAASLALHESLGFTRIGVMRRVGEKFGRVLDVVLMDLHLDEHDGADRAP